MTTIAWDGKQLAADTMMTDGDMRVSVRKLRRLDNGLLVGGAGNAIAIGMFIDWLSIPGDLEAPEFDNDGDESEFVALVIMQDGAVVVYDKHCFPLDVYEPHYAIGSGRCFAMGAMDAGFDAVAAIQSAIKRDVCTGGDIQVLSLDGRSDRLLKARQ